jgi:hypothetical protein
MAQWNMNGLCCYFVTLTYPKIYANDWHIWKRDMEAFRKRIGRKYPHLIGYCWRMEFQERGAPHFHLIMAMDQEVCTCGGGERKLVKKNGKQEWRWVHKYGCKIGPFRSEIANMWPEIVREGYRTSGGDMEAYSVHFELNKEAGTGVEAMMNRKQVMCYVSKYMAKTDQANAPESWGRSWGFINANGSLDFSPVETVTLQYEEAVMLKRLIKRWLKSRGKGRYAEMLNMRSNYSILGLGADSENGRVLYKMLGGVVKGLFAPHNSPGGPGGASEAMPFLERVAAGLVTVSRPGLAEGVIVRTPRGLAEVSSIVNCSILHRVRVSVTLREQKNSDGSCFAAFDLWQVKPVVNSGIAAASQADLW